MSAEYHPYDIDLKTALLFDYTGKSSINIKTLIAEFNLYESLYDTHMRADITILDAIGLIERLPIIGEETLLLQFRTPGDKQLLKSYVFNVVNIHNRSQIQQRSNAYTLDLISTEYIQDNNTVVSRSYNGVIISDIVGDVFESYLRPATDSRFNTYAADKPISISQTDGLFHFVAPRSSPLNLIRYLATQAYSAQFNSSSFIFYEDSDKYNFTTVEQLLDGVVRHELYYHEYGVDTAEHLKTSKKPIFDSQKVSQLEFVNQIAITENYADLMYHSVLHTVDPLTKLHRTTGFEYQNNFNRVKHVDQFALTSPRSMHRSQNSPHQLLRHTQLSLGNQPYHQQDGFLQKTQNDPISSYPSRATRSIQQRRSSLAALQNIKLNLVIPGNSDVQVGQIINVFVPEQSSDKELLTQYNKLFGRHNPRFLVTAVNHSWDGREDHYSTTLECIKDSYGGKVVREATIVSNQQDDEWDQFA